jgi:hypothetical protein
MLSDVHQSSPVALPFTDIEILEAAIASIGLRRVNHMGLAACANGMALDDNMQPDGRSEWKRTSPSAEVISGLMSAFAYPGTLDLHGRSRLSSTQSSICAAAERKIMP